MLLPIKPLKGLQLATLPESRDSRSRTRSRKSKRSAKRGEGGGGGRGENLSRPVRTIVSRSMNVTAALIRDPSCPKSGEEQTIAFGLPFVPVQVPLPLPFPFPFLFPFPFPFPFFIIPFSISALTTNQCGLPVGEPSGRGKPKSKVEKTSAGQGWRWTPTRHRFSLDTSIRPGIQSFPPIKSIRNLPRNIPRPSIIK